MTELRCLNSVCGHLAQQLVSERAEVFKHQAIVKCIQESIIAKKTSIIQDLLMGCDLRIDKRLMNVIKVNSYNYEDNFMVCLTLAEEVYSMTNGIALTKKEEKIVNEYDNYVLKFIDAPYSGWERYILQSASELSKLKHGIRLIKNIYSTFLFDDAVAPTFFRQTDIFVGGNELYKGQLIEETIIRNKV